MARFVVALLVAALAVAAVRADYNSDLQEWEGSLDDWESTFNKWKDGSLCEQPSGCPGLTMNQLRTIRMTSVTRYFTALLNTVDLATTQIAIRSSLQPDVVLHVPATGTWTGVESAVEYLLVTKPQLNGGLYWITKYDYIPETVKWEGDTVTFKTSELFFWPRLFGTDMENVTLPLSSNYSVTFGACSPLMKELTVDIDPATVPRAGVVDVPTLCGGIMAKCTGANQVYASIEACIGFIMSLPRACDKFALQGNTQFCRQFHFLNALVNPNVHCIHTSMTGGGKCFPTADCPMP
eukprot:Opistho-1_new@62251